MSSDGAEIKVTFPRAQGQKGLVAAQYRGFPFSVCSKLCHSLLRFRCGDTRFREHHSVTVCSLPHDSTDVNLKPRY